MTKSNKKKNGRELEKLIDKVHDNKWTSHFYGVFLPSSSMMDD